MKPRKVITSDAHWVDGEPYATPEKAEEIRLIKVRADCAYEIGRRVAKAGGPVGWSSERDVAVALVGMLSAHLPPDGVAAVLRIYDEEG